VVTRYGNQERLQQLGLVMKQGRIFSAGVLLLRHRFQHGFEK